MLLPPAGGFIKPPAMGVVADSYSGVLAFSRDPKGRRMSVQQAEHVPAVTALTLSSIVRAIASRPETPAAKISPFSLVVKMAPLEVPEMGWSSDSGGSSVGATVRRGRPPC